MNPECEECEEKAFCILTAVIEEIRSLFGWADVKIDIEHIGEGEKKNHKIKVEPQEAYEAVMIIFGSFIRQANANSIYLAQTRKDQMGSA